MVIKNQSIVLCKHHVNLLSQSLGLHKCYCNNAFSALMKIKAVLIESSAIVNLRDVSTKLSRDIAN